MTVSVSTPNLALLGWCDRAARIEGANPAFSHTNIQGLAQTRFSNIFPVSLRGITLAWCLYNPKPGDSFFVEFQYPEGSKAFDFTLTLGDVMQFDMETQENRRLESMPIDLGWTVQTCQIGTDVLVLRPGSYKAVLKCEGQEQFLGYLHLLHSYPPPYSPDQIAALRSDPLARRLVRIVYSCTDCGKQLRAYAGLEPNRKLEKEGYTWYADLAEQFKCSCGKLDFSLLYLKTGLHGLLSRNLAPDDQIGGAFQRLYETTKLEEDCRQFKKLIESDVPEQQVQDFLEDHLIFFARFSAHRLIPKPRIQNKYLADFAILNHRKELLLVEIERPQICLLTKNRRITAELQHARTQVTDWIQEVDDHRAAVLNSLKIELREVAVVRGIVIAGRSPTDDEEGRSLRRAFSGDVEFYTYDDLLDDTTQIIRRVANA